MYLQRLTINTSSIENFGYVAYEINDSGSNQIRKEGSEAFNGGITGEAKKELVKVYEDLKQEVVKGLIQFVCGQVVSKAHNV